MFQHINYHCEAYDQRNHALWSSFS